MPRQRLAPHKQAWPPPGWGDRLSPSKAQRAANSRHQREWRRRRACNIRLLRVPVLETELAWAMIESGRLSAAEALDPAALTRAASEILAEWAASWTEKA